jgi:hypothetical protein
MDGGSLGRTAEGASLERAPSATSGKMKGRASFSMEFSHFEQKRQ